MRQLLLALLLFSLVGCSASSWKSDKFAAIVAAPSDQQGVRPAYLLKVLDGLAQRLYEDGFLFQTSGSDFRPPAVFSRASSFRNGSLSFIAQTTFVVIDAPTQSVSVVVRYTDDKQILWTSPWSMSLLSGVHASR